MEEIAFPSTRHSLLYQAEREDRAGGRPALNELLSRYRPALIGHLMRRRRCRFHDAEDLLGEFIRLKVLEGDLLQRVDQKKGRFRTYLLTCLDNYLCDVARRRQAAKRSPAGGLVDIDEHRDAALSGSHADRTFDVEWARAVIHGALERMRAHCRADDCEQLWQLFEARIVRPLLHQEPQPVYDQIIADFGFSSYSQVTKAMTTAKRLYLSCLRAEVADYTLHPEQVDEEINDLRRIVAQSDG